MTETKQKNKIWIDGDACPKAIKDIIFKAVNRSKIECVIVANQFINIPLSNLIKRLIVEPGFDKADDKITELVNPGDLVITADLPLAETCLVKQAQVISPRGELYSLNSIKQKLAMRDFNEVMRGSGIHSSGPKAMASKDMSQFANQLDRLLAKMKVLQ